MNSISACVEMNGRFGDVGGRYCLPRCQNISLLIIALQVTSHSFHLTLTIAIATSSSFKFKFIKSSKRISYNEHRLQIAS